MRSLFIVLLIVATIAVQPACSKSRPIQAEGGAAGASQGRPNEQSKPDINTDLTGGNMGRQPPDINTDATGGKQGRPQINTDITGGDQGRPPRRRSRRH
jgi:hypothetical protein